MSSKNRPVVDAYHPKDSTLKRASGFMRKETSLRRTDASGEERGTPLSSRREELCQLVRYRSVHLRRIAVVEVLRTANGLSLGQHLLDERCELDCANGIVVEYLAEFRCEPLLISDTDRYTM